MTPTVAVGSRNALRTIAYVMCVTPLLRWLVAHHTVAYGQPWRTRCDGCGTGLWPVSCRPVGRCAGCHRRIGAAPYVVEAATAAAAGLLVLIGLRGWELAAYTWWSATTLVLAFIDAAVSRLPHRLTAATALGWIILVTPTGASAVTWWSALGTAAGLAVFYGLFHIATPSGLGLGDVALVVPAGLALGWLDWRYAIAALLLAHSAAAMTVLIRRVRGTGGRSLPLGVYLAAASGGTVLAALAT